MKLSRLNIINMKGAKDEIKDNYNFLVQKGGNISNSVDTLVHQVRANYNSTAYDLVRKKAEVSEDMRDYKKAKEQGKKPMFTKTRLESDMKDLRQETVYNILDRNVGLVTLHEIVKNEIGQRKRFDWLFHPIRTYRQNKALEMIENAFEEFDIEVAEINTLHQILDSETNDIEAAVEEDGTGLTYSKEEEVREPIEVEEEVEEAEEEETTNDFEELLEIVQPEKEEEQLNI